VAIEQQGKVSTAIATARVSFKFLMQDLSEQEGSRDVEGFNRHKVRLNLG
jgi:hypothetical protein